MEGYVHGALRKELCIASFTERFKKLLWEGFTDAFCQYLEPLITTLHFCSIFVVGRLLQCDLRKKLRIAPFVERFKTASLGRSY